MADPVSLGITVALTAAQMLAQASQHIEGPRLKDLSTTVAEYGTPLNNLIGTSWVTGTCFYAEPIKETPKKRKGKGGKQTNYTYTGTWAIAVADHEVGAIRKIKFDGHLIYDATSAIEIYPLADDYELASHIRFYLGTETQDADPRMLATVEARDGAGTCPAYRGVSYIFFEEVPLEKLGNRLPIVTIEVSTLPLSGAGSTSFDLDGVSDAAFTAAGIVAKGNLITATPADVLVVTMDHSGAYVAFSPWGVPSPVGYHTGSLVKFAVVEDGGGTFSSYGAAVSNGYAAARTAWEAAWPSGVVLTGASTYHFGIPDTPVGDNTGGVSISVTVLSGGGNPLLSDLLTRLSLEAGLESEEFDYSDLDQEIIGFSWTQGTVKQIVAGVCDAHDCDLVPHDFVILGRKRGTASAGTISSDLFVTGDLRYRLNVAADRDLPRRIALTFADIAADQQPNTAVAQRTISASASARELALDMSPLALGADAAKQLVDRFHRRVWFGREAGEFALSRQWLALEPGDVWTPVFDGEAVTMRLTSLAFGADGTIKTVWAGDDPALALLSGAAGAPATGITPGTLFDPAATAGAVLDLPLLSDAHDTPTPFLYLAAGPVDDKVFPGADVAWSETGEADTFAQGWAAVPSSAAATIGTMSDVLPAALAWQFDYGSSVEVVLGAGTLTSSSEDAVLNDGALNLALIGAELVQFVTATLTAPLTYQLTGLLRGVRGTERFIGSHGAAEQFFLMDAMVQRRTVGAGEIGDSDSYILTSIGFAPDELAAQAVEFSAAAHKPYAPVHGSATLSGGDWSITATRRTRIGGATLNGQDVPLGEAAEAWEADIMDGATVKRTLTGAALPLTYTAAMQTTDWGGAQTALAVRLYQMNPTLSLRGYVLEITG